MKRLLALTVLFGSVCAFAEMTAKTVWRQRWPWDTKVEIDFTLTGGEKCDVEVVATFTTNGVAGTVDLEQAAGVKGSFYELRPGFHKLEWDPAAAGFDVTKLENFAVTVTPVENAAVARAWLVVDLKTGKSEYLALGEEEKNDTGKAWTDETYKMEKMVFRRIPAGTFIRGYTQAEKEYLWGLDDYENGDACLLTAAETTLTSDYYISIYQVSRYQLGNIVDMEFSNASKYPDLGQLIPSGSVCYQRGSNAVEGINWPLTKFAVTEGSVVGKYRAKCGNRFMIDLPTCAQWMKAARPDTQWLWYDTSSFPGGMEGGKVGDTLDTITNIIARISHGYSSFVVRPNWNPPSESGLYLPNSYGMCDLIGSRSELVLDYWNGQYNDLAGGAVDSSGIDPVGQESQKNGYRMLVNSFNNIGSVSIWSIGNVSQKGNDAVWDPAQGRCYRYVINLRPPRSFNGKWFND